MDKMLSRNTSIDPDLREAVYMYLEEKLVHCDWELLDIKAGDVQCAIRAHGRTREVCVLLQDDSLVRMAALELIEKVGPNFHHATIFRYKVHRT